MPRWYDHYDRKGFICCQLCEEELSFECSWRGCECCDPYYNPDQEYVGRSVSNSPFCDKCYHDRKEEVKRMISTRRNTNAYQRWEKHGKMGPPVGLVHVTECDGSMWHQSCKLKCVDQTHLCSKCGGAFCSHPHVNTDSKVLPSETKNVCQTCSNNALLN